ncbi:MAG: diaminopimelate decarboxylase [SAR86 cluster bacterium]|nr:diaminopimelate decarboxylase [SAR86 cluster bacterium]
MKGFNKKNNILCVDEIQLTDLAEEFGTPAYIYSGSVIKENYQKYLHSLRAQDMICFAVKSNSNLQILKLLADLDSGFDVVSANEIRKALLAGANPKKIVFSGVGKTTEELKFAIDSDILFINIESYSELIKLNQLAVDKKIVVQCSLRLNPDISAQTHEYISTGLKDSKFGLSKEVMIDIAKDAKNLEGIALNGISCHIGSQITDPSILLEVLEKVKICAEEFIEIGLDITHLNLGGGIGITYNQEDEISIENIVSSLVQELGENYKLILEPGRSIVGNSGVIITKVELIKKTENSSFAFIDAGMNDLLRPALYNAWHNITSIEDLDLSPQNYTVVGPVCESADIFGEKRNLAIKEGSILAIHSSGAYGFTMSSNYNSRTKPPEILVEETTVKLIRRKESFEDMVKLEKEI